MIGLVEKAKRTSWTRLGKTWERPIWGLLLSICLRALHQLGAGLFLASVLFGYGGEDAGDFLSLSVFSGIALLLAEWVRHLQIYRELSGLVTFCKCALIGLGVHAFIPVEPAVVAGFLVASVGAHAPKQIRHRLLF